MNLHEQLRKAPYVRLVLVLIAGIMWQASEYGISFPMLYPTLIFAIIYFILINIRYNIRASQQLTGGAGILCLFFAGAAIMQQQPTGSSLPLNKNLWLQVEVCDNPQCYDNYVKIQAIVKRYATEKDTITANEKIFMYLAADTSQPVPVAGATLFAYSSLSLIPPPGNPDEFNYQQYLMQQKIFASTFVHQGNYFIDNCLPWENNLWYMPIRWQQYGLDVFANGYLDNDEYAVMAALTLGNKQWLRDEVRDSYIAAGAMHILAVSGLHVGIIMMVLRFIFAFLNKFKKGILYKNILIIISLWLYAAIVGFSPSVTRAAVMFSFVLAGETMRRKISIYNSLAASAFFIVWFNPQIIFAAGFQLSYCAVLGIVYFQPRIASLLYVKNKILNYIWQLATVSLAAQIGTLPISLLNFHIFPNYFLLTNVCVISLTSLIIYHGVALIVVNWVPFLSDIIGYMLKALLWLLNHIVIFVESLPCSVISNIYINNTQTWLLVVLTISVALYMAVHRKRWLLTAACVLMTVVGINTLHIMQCNKQKMMVVYKVKDASYIEFIDSRHTISLRDTVHIFKNFTFNTGNFLVKHGIASHEKTFNMNFIHQDTLINGLCCYKDFIIFGNELYKILDNELIDKRLPAISIDYLIVTGTAKIHPDVALTCYAPQQIIVDSSVPQYRARQWIHTALARNVPIHNIREDGAFVKIYNL